MKYKGHWHTMPMAFITIINIENDSVKLKNMIE